MVLRLKGTLQFFCGVNLCIVFYGLFVYLEVIDHPRLITLNLLEEKSVEPNVSEIYEILKSTPNLWRKFKFMKNETIMTRVKDQTFWIQRISQTDYIKRALPKNILVQDGMKTMYYRTEGRMKCPYAPEFETKCNLIEATSNSTKKPNNSTKLNTTNENITAITNIRYWRGRKSIKLPDNIYQIMYVLENPAIAQNADLGLNNALLASYWKGSDILLPYYLWILDEIEAKKYAYNDPITTDDILKKTKLVFAAVSNCNQSSNGRLKYIQQLQKLIKVDVYGKCGTLKCGSRSTREDCSKEFGETYKFYLAFENSNCEDYITEKFYVTALQNNLVPVVLGAKPDNYKDNSPLNSYIHVDDFASPKELADYLTLLDNNDTMYMEYFKWKGSGYFKSEFNDFFCKACGMLFYADFMPQPKWPKKNMQWKDANYCLPSGKWNWK